jgi:hypothetical protein
VNNLRKLKRSEHLLTEGIEQNKKLKEKLKKIKEHYLIITLKIAMRKQKMKNLLFVKSFLENNLLKWMKKLKSTKELKKKRLFSQLFAKFSEIQNDITNFTSNNEFIKRRKFLLSNSFLDKITQKMQKVKDGFDEEFQTIFIEKKSDIDDIFNLFKIVKIIQNQDPFEEFINNMKYILRDTILKICKEKIIPFTKENITLMNNHSNEKKFKYFKNYSMRENQFFNCIPTLLKSLLPLAEVYNSYMNNNNNNNDSEIKKVLYEKREEFFTLFEKKISKVILILFNDIPNIINNSFTNKKWLYMLLCLINIFSDCLRKEFDSGESVYIKKLLEEIIKIQSDSIIKIHIRKTGILLGGDNWKRLALQDNNEIFSETKSGIPMYFKKYLTIFNKEGRDYIQNIKKNSYSKFENVKNLFEKMSDKIENFFSPKINKDGIDIKILSKKIENSKNIVSTSSYSVLKSYKEIIDNVILFESISFDLYIQILNLTDYFILSSVNLLMLKKFYLAQVFQLINIEEVKKNGNLVETFPFALFLESFKHMRLLFLITRDNLSKLYLGGNVDFLNNMNADDTDSKSVYFPKLNSDITLSATNVYTLLIESIIIIESIISVYRYIKKMRIVLIEETEEQKKILDNKMSLYKKAISEIRLFLYKPLCYNIFKMEPIVNKMQNQRWVLNEDDNLDFSIASPFIHTILEEMYEKYDKLNSLSGGSLTTQSQIRFLDIMIKFFVENLQISVCLIKNINSTGRSFFLKDIKILKMQLEDKFKEYKKKIQIENYFSQLSLFLNSWYSKEDDLIQYIKESKLDYKYMTAILYKGEYFEKLGNKEKEIFKKKVDELYMELLVEINDDLLNNYSNKKIH